MKSKILARFNFITKSCSPEQNYQQNVQIKQVKLKCLIKRYLNANIKLLQCKGQNPDYLKSHVVYEFSCPACNAGYIVKTDRNLGTRIKEHCGFDKN